MFINSKVLQSMDSMKFRISGHNSKAVRLAHYRAMYMNPEDVSGFDHENSSFIVDSNITPLDANMPNPFLRWCESLGEVKIEIINSK